MDTGQQLYDTFKLCKDKKQRSFFNVCLEDATPLDMVGGNMENTSQTYGTEVS